MAAVIDEQIPSGHHPRVQPEDELTGPEDLLEILTDREDPSQPKDSLVSQVGVVVSM